MDFYDHLNDGEKYLCDRCGIVELRADEYYSNRKNDFIYCDECFYWIHLQKWTDSDGHSHTIRSERIVSTIVL